MKTKIVWLIKNEDGQGMVEYSLILVLVVLVALAGILALGISTNELFENVIVLF